MRLPPRDSESLIARVRERAARAHAWRRSAAERCGRAGAGRSRSRRSERRGRPAHHSIALDHAVGESTLAAEGPDRLDNQQSLQKLKSEPAASGATAGCRRCWLLMSSVESHDRDSLTSQVEHDTCGSSQKSGIILLDEAVVLLLRPSLDQGDARSWLHCDGLFVVAAGTPCEPLRLLPIGGGLAARCGRVDVARARQTTERAGARPTRAARSDATAALRAAEGAGSFPRMAASTPRQVLMTTP